MDRKEVTYRIILQHLVRMFLDFMLPLPKIFTSNRLGGFGLLIVFLGLAFSSLGQVSRYPANVTPVLGVPYSLFFNEYAEPGSNQLTTSVVFNDFNEAEWNFRFRLTIESSNIRIVTSPNFIPNAPITLQPGVPEFLSGDDWAEYFNFNNIVVDGSYRNEFFKTGRLPEGFYNFCVEVLDYQTGETLSRKSCASAWIQLNDPPMINLPVCGSYVDPKNTQIPFQWQLFNTSSPNSAMGTSYQFTMWEITDPTANPLSAVANGQALQVYQSDLLTTPNLYYGPGEPALEEGKVYLFRVQAKDPDGKDTFKNDGFSEFCYFSYGWPMNGKIELLEPSNKGGFKSRDVPVLKWSNLSNQIQGQLVNYKIEVAEIEEGVVPNERVHFNDLWYDYTSPPNAIIEDKGHSLRESPKKTKIYAWRVTAFTDNMEVGKSEPFVFYGPGLVERFYAGGHTVWVDAITNADIANLAGEGRVRLTENSDVWTKVEFSGLTLSNNSGFYTLVGGDIFYEPDTPLANPLNPDVDRNLLAAFDIDRYRINKDGIYVYGNVAWDLPFAALTTEKAIVATKKNWMNFNDFQVNGAQEVDEQIHFDLLDPFKFGLDIYSKSLVYVYANEYRFEWNGHVTLPDNVEGNMEDEVQLPFELAEQIFYIENESPVMYNHVSVLNNARIDLKARKFTIDFSDEESPGKLVTDVNWKGAYFGAFDLTFNTNVDVSGQLNFDEAWDRSYDLSAGNEYKAWVTSKGLDFELKDNFDDDAVGHFNTFPSTFREITLDITGSVVQNDCQIIGDMLIPVISVTEPYDFTIPISGAGFRTGYLEGTGVDGEEFTFNKNGGEQLVNIKIQRAVFADNNRLNMTIDLEWPSINTEMTSLVGFKAWGDYSIGFNVKNGSLPLTNRIRSTLSDYSIELHTVGAGSSEGYYSFAVSLDILLGEDVSGSEGPPLVNLYSLEKNPFLPEDQVAVIEGVDPASPQTSFEDAVKNAEEDHALSQAKLRNKLLDEKENIIAKGKALQESLASDGGQYHELEGIYSGPGFDPGVSALDQGSSGFYGKLNESQRAQFDSLVLNLVKILASPVTKKVDSVASKITTRLNKSIDNLTTNVTETIDEKVDLIVDEVAGEIAKALNNDQIDLSGAILEIGEATKASIKLEIASSLKEAVNNNLKKPLTNLIDDGIAGRINDHIITQASGIVYGVFEGKPNQSAEAILGVVTELPNVVSDIGEAVWAEINPTSLGETVVALSNEFITGIDPGIIASQISAAADEALKKAAADFLNDKVNDITGEYANEILSLGGPDSQMDFIGVGTRLAKGDVKGVFSADPVHVKLNTPVVSLDGFISYTPDDPTFGDVWAGDVLMKIKVPKPFEINALYFNGKVNDLNYWFCQIDPVPADGKIKKGRTPGGAISKEVREIQNPINMGIVSLVGATGRVFHHMKEIEGDKILPDAETNYGAYLNMVFFDGQGGSLLRLQLEGAVNSAANGDYTVEFNGNMQMLGSHQVTTIDKNSAIQGEVFLRYNSAEKHFFGYAGVDLKTEALCAGGSLLVDMKPGKWRVALGTSEDRLYFTPACIGWGATGWLDVNQNSAEIGLGLTYSIYAESPKINIGIAKFYVTVDAGIAAGIMAAVQYNPSFKMLKAGIWVEIWVDLGLHYKTPLSKWKHVSLVEIFIRGDLMIIFDPSPTTLEGSVRGYVKILGLKKSFNASMKMTL